MKFYIYISETKVDMLYNQIPTGMLSKLGKELNVDVKALIVSAGLKVKYNEPKETLYSKLSIVERYIEKNYLAGTVDKPKVYFKATLPMRWGTLNSTKDAIYFGGFFNDTIIGLCGSLKHLIAKPSIGKVDDYMDATGSSELPFIYDILKNEVDRANEKIPEKDEYRIPNPWWDPANEKSNEQLLVTDGDTYILNETQWMTVLVNGIKEQVEFLAVKLVHGSTGVKPMFQTEEWENACLKRGLASDLIKNQKRVLLGSPIYVARSS